MPRRWLLILALFPIYVAFMAWIATAVVFLIVSPADWFAGLALLVSPADWELGNLWWWYFCGIPAQVICASQITFLVPIVYPPRLAHGRQKTLILSLISAAFVAGVLTVGLAYGVLGLAQLIASYSSSQTDPSDHIAPTFAGIVVLTGMSLLIISWVFWSILLYRFTRKKRDDRIFSKLLSLLFGATIVEILVVLPIDVMIRRRTDCYCNTGTFWTMCLSGWSLLWLAGPGALLALTSKRRRFWADTNCIMCGYEKGPSPGSKCPECAYEWSDS